MENKGVVLQRKQPREFVINYPYGDRGNKEYKFMGTRGDRIYEREVPMDVFEWLTQYTTTIKDGELIIKPEEIESNEDVYYIREGIENIDQMEEAILTKEEIIKILETGNHNVLKKKLRELTENKVEEVAKAIRKQFLEVAGEVGVDSSAKRQALCNWLNVDFEISDVIFDKNIEDLHN